MHIERNTASNRHSKLVYALIFLLQISLVTDVFAYNKRMYRFVDENGKTVVSSTLPPEVSQNGYEIINEMGVVLQVVAPRKTDEQLRQEALEAKQLEAERLMQLEQEKLDAILINSYSDISDIERARDIELESKDRNVMLLRQNIRRYTRLLEDAQTRAARDERMGREVGDSLLLEIEQFKRRIAREQKEVDDTEEQKEIINDRYNSSIIRFSELKAAERLRQFSRNRNDTMERHTIYECKGLSVCDTAWAVALRFASEYSTTELAWANESTIMMRKPVNDNDLSLVMTRVNNSTGDAASIVLEVRCTKTLAGEAFCESPKVQGVKDNFVRYLSSGPTSSPS